MTLKQYLETHNINVSPDDRSKLGALISQKNDSNGRTIEDGHNVKDYKIEFLNDSKTITKILNFLRFCNKIES